MSYYKQYPNFLVNLVNVDILELCMRAFVARQLHGYVIHQLVLVSKA